MCKAHDATFELTDAILLTRKAYCLADLSISPVFRRKWSSIYEALQDTRPQRQKLMRLYIEQIPTHGRIVLAGDHTVWVRPNAYTLCDRTMEHYCTTMPANKPIAPGEGYSTIAWIPEESGSWAMPLRHERITGWESPISKAVWQLKQVCKYLPTRPISLWDSEYGCAPFILKTADIEADKLMRLRSNLCLWGSPPPYSGRGRPRIHGNKFKLNDPETWIEPGQTLEENDFKLGLIRIRVWHDLHLKSAAKHPISLLLVERLNQDGSTRISKPLWLAWVGQQMPCLDEIWRLYLRRFAVDALSPKKSGSLITTSTRLRRQINQTKAA
ncbi:transposase [Scytonema sp. PCC 10023]|uniref:transposase n=1 Tax=Scytonema sp. PCC 10023 TaxID=1680591 RepID=UPI0039C625B4